MPLQPEQTVEEALTENATGPAKASGDSGSVEQHSLTDQIEVDRYMASKKAANEKARGLRFSKLAGPGASEMG